MAGCRREGCREVFQLGHFFGRLRPPQIIFHNVDDWEARKALEFTVSAYLDAFTADDAVLHVVKSNPVDYTTWRRPAQALFRAAIAGEPPGPRLDLAVEVTP